MDASQFISIRDQQRGASWSTDNDELSAALEDFATLKIAENYQNLVGKTKKTPGKGVDAHAEIIQMLVKALAKDKTGELEGKVKLLLADYKETKTIKIIRDRPITPHITFDQNNIHWQEIISNRRQMVNSLIAKLETPRSQNEDEYDHGYDPEEFRQHCYLAFDTRGIIRLIKAVRQFSGLGLKDAKELVENFLTEDLNEDPEEEMITTTTPSPEPQTRNTSEARLRETEPQLSNWTFDIEALARRLRISPYEARNFASAIQNAQQHHDLGALTRAIRDFNMINYSYQASETLANDLTDPSRNDVQIPLDPRAYERVNIPDMQRHINVQYDRCGDFGYAMQNALRRHNFVEMVKAIRDFNGLGMDIQRSKIYCERILHTGRDHWGRNWDGLNVRAMASRLNIPSTQVVEFEQAVSECIPGRKIINVIKLVRQYTGMGLKEVKDFVEAELER